MRLAPADQDDRLAKAALFTKYAELLPAALMADSSDALLLVSDLLLGIREVIAGNKLAHQNFFRCAPLPSSAANFLAATNFVLLGLLMRPIWTSAGQWDI